MTGTWGATIVKKSDLPAQIATIQSDPTMTIYAIYEVDSVNAVVIQVKRN